MYVHVPYIYVLGTVRQCKEDFVTVQLPCKPTYTWYIPVKAFSRQTLCRRYAAKDHILFNQNEKHDFNQILAYHFRIPAYHTTRFLIRIMSYTGIIPVNIPHCICVQLPRCEARRAHGSRCRLSGAPAPSPCAAAMTATAPARPVRRSASRAALRHCHAAELARR